LVPIGKQVSLKIKFHKILNKNILKFYTAKQVKVYKKIYSKKTLFEIKTKKNTD